MITWAELEKNEAGLVPVVVQDANTREILMLAYANEVSFNLTIQTQMGYYYSRSRQSLWQKGQQSGHVQKIVTVTTDCDRDTLLYQVHQSGPACHTGQHNCFFEPIVSYKEEISIGSALGELAEIISKRKKADPTSSYTAKLLHEGVDRIAKKVGEEAAEVIIAAKNRNSDEMRWEVSDLMYHLSVLLENQELSWQDVANELIHRHKKDGTSEKG